MSRTSSTERRPNGPQRDRSISALELFESFGEPRPFARRGGIAGRGSGSSLTPPDPRWMEGSEEADDSGYYSHVIHEEEEDEDTDLEGYPLSPPLSPRSVPPRVRTKQRKRKPSCERPSLKRRPSWRPNLKHDFIFEHALEIRERNHSIDNMIATDVWHKSDSHMYSMAETSCTTTASAPASMIRTPERPEPRRQSTLLHPSSPTIEAVSFQTMQSLPRAKIVHIRHPSNPRSATPKTSSTSLPADEEILAPVAHRPTMPPRKGSSLLHPSCPTSETCLSSQLKTILSLPPKNRDMPETTKSTSPHSSLATSPEHTTPSIPALSLLASALPVPTSVRTASADRHRQTSVIHSCLSDLEDEDLNRPQPQRQAVSDDSVSYGQNASRSVGLDKGLASSFRGHLAEATEDAIFARIDRKVQRGRRMWGG
jgi:hypothetical protein